MPSVQKSIRIPEEIEAHIRANAGQTKEAVLKRFPFLAKPEALL